MASMDNLDFSDLPDPVVDLSVSGILGDDDMDNEKYYTDNISGDSEGNKYAEGGDTPDDEETYNDNDVSYDNQPVDSVLADLYRICDREGVACTAPMEALIKSRHAEETIYLSSLEWFVRGIVLANQTQILPTIMTTISELKIENRTLQQASNKINRESEQVKKLSSDLVKELTAIKEDMKDSFRTSMRAFIEESNKTTRAVTGIVDKTLPPATMGNRASSSKSMPSPDHIPPPTSEVQTQEPTAPALSKEVAYLKEKKAVLKKAGFTNKWFEDIGDDILDIVYDDELHSTVRTLKMTPTVKKMIVDAVNDQLEDLLKE
ncbi:phosphoprotein [Plumbago necrotic spot associated virus]|nr:phosphoprotein [Plumbago necrotic spot associated virus]